MSLYAFDLRSKQHRVIMRASDLAAAKGPASREEELRRERQRVLISGITSYAWADRANVMLLPLGGQLFVRREDGSLLRLDGDGVVDPHLCADGTKIAFSRSRELWLTDLEGRARALTRDAPSGVTRGQSDFNMQEEFDEPHGIWWSPSCDRIAYLEVDEREVGEVPILGFRDGPDLQELRYPRSGGKNPTVRLGISNLEGATTWVELERSNGFDDDGGYLGRVAWSKNGRALFLQRLSREQHRLELIRVDPDTGAARVLVAHEDPAWTDMTTTTPLVDGRVLTIWHRDGRRHLALVDGETGGEIDWLTGGTFDVFRIVGVDREGRVLFIANRDAPLERGLYRLDPRDREVMRMSEDAGVHAIEGGRLEYGFVDIHSANDRPPRVAIHDPEGVETGRIDVADADEIETLGVRPAALVTVPGDADTPTLHGALLKPRGWVPGKLYPSVVIVYGGPGVQSVLDEYNPRLLWQHLADRGFFVFQVDNRGARGLGHAFETPIYQKLGEVELDDQLRALAWLKKQPGVDPNRVGLYGHSYGGFMTLSAMLRRPGSYQAGVAGSPVTDWSLYDTGYTERYMGTPQSNPEGYAATNLAPVAKNLAGKLLVIHALMDENVHFEHTARITDALVEADRDFDLLVFPGERHGYRSMRVRQFVYRRVVDFFVKNL